jgi:hypothetical protein
LKTETPKSASDELGDRISRRVEEMVEKSLTGALSLDRETEAPVNVAKWSMIGLLNVAILVAIVIAIILLVKLAF